MTDTFPFLMPRHNVISVAVADYTPSNSRALRTWQITAVILPCGKLQNRDAFMVPPDAFPGDFWQDLFWGWGKR